ncbi:MAG: HIT domain-containing protein [Gammaproteobacteria bacterium]|nr:HIT domain-containing protein [Gammaproteobacteria bacterium]
MKFSLHPQLSKDTFTVAELPLCKVLLMNDCRYPWLILVPALDQLTELHQVPKLSQQTLFDEITSTSTALEKVCKPFKLNVAALGNQVSQLHIHVIARRQDDVAWPGPVWGVGKAQPYNATQATALIADLNQHLS